MKNQSFSAHILLVFLLSFILVKSLQAQEWTRFLPEEKVKNHTLTLKDYQMAFNHYWKMEKTERNLKIEKEDEVRDENYEKFKRWEWFWKPRVDPVTGTFPMTTAWDIYQKYLRQESKNTQYYDSGNWKCIGPFASPGGYIGLGRINCVAFSSLDTSILYVGTASGGVWKTTNLGKTWVPLGDFNTALGVSDILVENHGGDDIIYLGTGDKDAWDTHSIGVLKSLDGGKTWQKTGLTWKYTDYALVYCLLKDPVDDNTIYVATNKGLYKTIDGGINFVQINKHSFRQIVFNPKSKNIMYAGDSRGGIFYSIDRGKSWIQVLDKSGSGAGRVAIAVSPDSANVVYGVVVGRDNGLLGVYRSQDNGHTFSVVQDTLNLLGYSCNGEDKGGQGWYDLTVVVDPQAADKIYVGGVNNWVSDDGGHHWKLANHWSSTCSHQNEIVHADKHDLLFQAKSHALFECNDGGIYKSNDGKHWIDLTNGMAISQIYRLNASAVNQEIITGLQDNGTMLFSSDIWKNIMSGDGMDCQIDYTDANIQYGELSYGRIYRTKDHWTHSKRISDKISGKGEWITPFLLDPKKHKTLYVGYQDVFQSTDQGNSWTKLSNWNYLAINTLFVLPSDTRNIFASSNSDIYKSNDRGKTWKRISSKLPLGHAKIRCFTVKNDDPNTIWVVLGGYNFYGIYETDNGGKSWKDISTGLPKIPINCIIQDTAKQDTVELYAGTDVGVFVKQGFSRWVPFNNRLPNVVVNDLEIKDETKMGRTLIAATFGRGLWFSPLFKGSLAPIKQALFKANTLSPNIGDTVLFSDLSTNHPSAWKWQITPSNHVSFVGSSTDTSQNPRVVFDKEGYYTVKLTAYDADTFYTCTETNYIWVKDLLRVTVKANKTTVCTEAPNDTTQLFAIVKGGSGKYSFSWNSEPEGWTSNEQNPVVRPFADSVLYKVKVNDSNSSVKGQIKIYRGVCSGVRGEKALGQLVIFPNPNIDLFTIKAEKKFYRITIYNEAGERVFDKRYNTKETLIQHHFRKGIYFIKIFEGSSSGIDGTITKQFLVK